MMSSTLSHPLAMGTFELDHSLPEFMSKPSVAEPSRPDSTDTDSADDEHKLVQALRKGDEDAFRSLIDQYHSRLLRLARAYVPSEAVAEEVVQETWLGVLDGIHRFEERSSLKTWIFQILTNRAKTRGKRESRYVTFSEAAHKTDQEEDMAMEPERFHSSGLLKGHCAIQPTTWDEKTPERLLLSKEGMATIEKAIDQLPTNYRQVMVLRDIEGIASDEICKLLNLTPTNQRVLLHRARSKVREVLNQYLQGELAEI